MILVVPGQVVEPPPTEEPPAPPPPPPAAHLSIVWSAPWLNRSWDLSDPTANVVRLKGATPTGFASPAHRRSSAVALDGATWGGVRIPEDEIFHPVMVKGETAEEFLAENAAFLASLDPDHEGVMRWVRPDGSWREAPCRYESGAESATVEVDPVHLRTAVYGVTWIRDDPYWRGPAVTQTFSNPTPVPFFPGPPFTLMPSTILGSATITNPGDVPAAPVWTVVGPFTGFSVGIGSSVVSMTLTKTAGQYVTIDMTPGVLSITDESNTDRWAALTAVDFTPVPPGDSQLVTTVTGAGVGSSVSLSFIPRYRRAW